MSAKSRLERGDDPADVAKIFGLPVEYCESIAKGAAKKKAAKKAVKKSK